MKKKRNDNEKTMRDLRAKTILIAKLYKLKAKKMMNILDQLIRTSRATCTDDVLSMLKLIQTIKKLKKLTTNLKKIVEKKEILQKKNNTWATIARRDIAMIKLYIDTNKTLILSSKEELKMTIKIIEQNKIQMIQKIISKEIVKKTRDINVKQSSRKKILSTLYHFEEVIVLKISNEKSRKALRSN